jgi:hypothetical protein
MDEVHEVLVPIHHAAPTEEHTYSPTPNGHGVHQSQQRRCDISFHRKDNCTSPGGWFSPEETKQNRQYSTQFIEDTQVLCKAGKMVIPNVLQHRVVSWYYRYLQHPGHTRLERCYKQQSIGQVLYTPSDRMSKNCHTCHINKMTPAQVWASPYKACYHKPLGNVMCGSNKTIHSQR